MKTYQFTFGSGLAWVNQYTIEAEDYESVQDALSALIDVFEICGYDGFFVTDDEINERGIFPDEYITSGNHNKHLLHFGTFYVLEIDNASLSKTLTNTITHDGRLVTSSSNNYLFLDYYDFIPIPICTIT